MKQNKTTDEEFEEAIKSVLLSKLKGKSGNRRMPSKEELGVRWKLTKK